MKDTTNSATAHPKRTLFGNMLYAFRLFLVNFLIFAALAEVGSIIIVHRKNWPSSRPNYHLNYNLFWADINPDFGVWHRPNGVFEHKGGCYDVTYYTNSYGARDAERSKHSTAPRTVVLGDSMMEGLGVPAEVRLSDVMERDTGIEQLNFGTGGNFGPLQYALLYKSMAANFDHNLVIVGVLPDNDFHDMDLGYWKSIGLGDRYRPYYDSNFSVFYTGHYDPNSGNGVWDHTEALLRAYLASYHVGQFIYTRFYWHNLHQYSGYNDWNDVDLERLKKSLEDIKATADAHGAKVMVFLIPCARDFERLHRAGTNRLGPVMESWGTQAGIPVKDLLPDMEARDGADWRSYFLPCDGHWSAKGNEVAAQILEPWLYPTNSFGGTIGKVSQ